MNKTTSWVTLCVGAALLFGATLAQGCGAEVPGTEDDSVVHGRRDGADGAVMALRIGDSALCTASLIAPRVLLTARHCVSELASESVDCGSRAAQVVSNHDPRELVVYSGTDVNQGTPLARGQHLVVPAGSRICDADIALIVLDRPVAGIAPLTPELREAPGVGSVITAVGFGRRGDTLGAGVRYRRTGVAVVAVDPREFQVGESTCNGDSGGPALDPQSGHVVGVVSRGGPSCNGPDVRNLYTRVDAWSTLVQQALTLGQHAG